MRSRARGAAFLRARHIAAREKGTAHLIRHIAWHRRQGRKVRASRGGVAHFAALHVSSGTKRAGAGAAAEFGDVALLHKPIHSAYLRSPWIRQRDVDEGASEGSLRGGLSGPLDFPLTGRENRGDAADPARSSFYFCRFSTLFVLHSIHETKTHPTAYFPPGQTRRVGSVPFLDYPSTPFCC